MDDWRSELVRTYPHLFFKIVDGELQLTASPRVGEGWRDTLERAMRRLDGIVREVEGSSIEIRQIKEKFGGLRIYLQTKGLDAHREQIDEIILLAERRAAGACEVVAKTVACGRAPVGCLRPAIATRAVSRLGTKIPTLESWTAAGATAALSSGP